MVKMVECQRELNEELVFQSAGPYATQSLLAFLPQNSVAVVTDWLWKRVLELENLSRKVLWNPLKGIKCSRKVPRFHSFVILQT